MNCDAESGVSDPRSVGAFAGSMDRPVNSAASGSVCKATAATRRAGHLPRRSERISVVSGDS